MILCIGYQPASVDDFFAMVFAQFLVSLGVQWWKRVMNVWPGLEDTCGCFQIDWLWTPDAETNALDRTYSARCQPQIPSIALFPIFWMSMWSSVSLTMSPRCVLKADMPYRHCQVLCTKLWNTNKLLLQAHSMLTTGERPLNWLGYVHQQSLASDRPWSQPCRGALLTNLQLCCSLVR